MMRNVSKNKAIICDGITDSIFHLCKECKTKKVIDMCERCQKKLSFAKSILKRSYWETEDSKHHFQSRLIPLNKKFPSIPYPS